MKRKIVIAICLVTILLSGYIIVFPHRMHLVDMVHYRAKKIMQHPEDTIFVHYSISEIISQNEEKTDSLVYWEYSWSGTPADSSIRAGICKMKYGKNWAYSVEIDDGLRQSALFAPDFFAQFKYSDAPPGEGNGKLLPVVGELAVFLFPMDVNATLLRSNELSFLKENGWSVSNHSYFHSSENLCEKSLINDLFWSQTILANRNKDHRAPVHFVYPFGDTVYAAHLDRAGIISASLVNGNDDINLYRTNHHQQLFLNRQLLDEYVWRHLDPLTGIPQGGFNEGDLLIDFTHSFNTRPFSKNLNRWKKRLAYLEQTYGSKGTDEFWSAPSGTVLSYVCAAKASVINVTQGKFTISFPAHLPGTPLTVKLENVPDDTQFHTPEGGLLYRKGNTVWITSPMLGLQGAPRPKPYVREIYRGVIAPDIIFSDSVKLAAVQIKTHGKPVDLYINTDRATEYFGSIKASSKYTMGYYLLSAVPCKNAVTTKGIHVNVPPNYCYHEIVIWALDE